MMPWFRVDDTLTFHVKAIAAGNAAMGLWVRAGAWSMATLTDGFVPTQVAHRIGTRSEIARLVTAGLWVEKDAGYLFHEWDQRQPSRMQIIAARQANAERLRRFRQRRRNQDHRGP